MASKKNPGRYYPNAATVSFYRDFSVPGRIPSFSTRPSSTSHSSFLIGRTSTSSDRASTSIDRASTSIDQPSTSFNQPSTSFNQPSTSFDQPSTSFGHASTSCGDDSMFFSPSCETCEAESTSEAGCATEVRYPGEAPYAEEVRYSSEAESSEVGSTSEAGSSSDGCPSDDQLPTSTTQLEASGISDGNSGIEEETDKVRQKLIENGQMDRLKDLLSRRLSEIGWHMRMTARCREVVQKNGSNTKFEMLFQAIRQVGQDEVPEHVRQYMLEKIRNSYGIRTRNVEDE